MRLISLCQFRDDAFWNFITSRSLPGRSDYVFGIEICWCSRRDREFTPEFLARLSELAADGACSFTVGSM
jgi:hypothetical protein